MVRKTESMIRSSMTQKRHGHRSTTSLLSAKSSFWVRSRPSPSAMERARVGGEVAADGAMEVADRGEEPELPKLQWIDGFSQKAMHCAAIRAVGELRARGMWLE